MPNRGGEVHPLGVDFADPVDVVEEVKPRPKTYNHELYGS